MGGKDIRKNKIRIIIAILLVVISIIPFLSLIHGINLLFFSNPEKIEEVNSNFKNIKEDDKNNNFSINVGFYSNNPDFFVGEKINVSVNIDIQTKERNESLILLSSFVSLVTTEGEYIPYENGHRRGRAMNKDPYSNDYFYLKYDTYLNFSGKYSFKFDLYYWDTNKSKLYEDEIVTKPLLLIEPSSVKAQLELANRQSELAIRNTGFAVIVITLAMVTILIPIYSRFEDIVNKIEYIIRINEWKKR